MTIIDYREGSSNTTYTYLGNYTPNEIAVVNDGTTDMTITVNGVDYTVKAYETFEARFPISFTEVGIATTSEYRMWIGR